MKIYILLFSLVVLILGLSLDSYGIFDPELSEPLFIFGIALSISSAALLTAKKVRARSWIKFSSWLLFASLIIILITPVSSNAWTPLYSIYREIVTWLMGGLFTLISLVLIVWKSVKR